KKTIDMLRAFCSIFVLKLIICTSEGHRDDGKLLSKAATFHFPEYAYKETSKNVSKKFVAWCVLIYPTINRTWFVYFQEITYHDYELACGQNSLCVNFNSAMVAKLNCLRRCISPSCYQDIYAFDELEEGEIDVRMNSFKGCVIQRM
ncbi:hypothetical protein KR215_001292, partial [Drosophila sulfurigaster]